MEITKDKRVPQAIEAERGVLGCMLISPEAVDKALQEIDDTCFYLNTHSTIFRAMVELVSKNMPVDIVTVSSHLESKGELELIGGRVQLANLIESIVAPSYIDTYIRLVLDAALKRKLIERSNLTIEECYSCPEDALSILDRAESRIFDIAENKLRGGLVPIGDEVENVYEMLTKIQAQKGLITGLTSGFKKLDSLLMGFQNSDLIIIAGRPSMGKTAFALNIVRENAIRQGIPVAIFSLEMSRQQIALRLLAAEAKVDAHLMRSGRLRKSDFAKLSLHLAELKKAPIYIDDSSNLNVLELRAKARRLKRYVDLGLIVIDYLQLMVGSKDAENRQQEIAMITRSIKGLAKELNIPVIALSQLSRMVERRERTSYKPQLSDLRESGAIEQDADVVIFIYRPWVYDIYEIEIEEEIDGRVRKKKVNTERLAEIIIGKQRNGPTGEIWLNFMREYTSFEERIEGVEEEVSGDVEETEFGGV